MQEIEPADDQPAAAAIRTPSEMNAGDWSDIVTAVIVAMVLGGSLIWVAINYKDAVSSPILTLAAILGASVGWVTGILISPYPVETSSFGELAKVIYGFLTGYVVSKFDPVLTSAISTGGERQWVIAAFGLVSFLIAVALTYITRRYWVSSKLR